jgi:hypothetical protein
MGTEHELIWMQCYLMPHPPSQQREEDHKRPVFDRFSWPVHDRLGSRQSGPKQQPAPVRPAADRSDRSYQGPGRSRSPRQEYHVKEKKEEVQPMQVDSGKTAANKIMQIGDVDVVVKDVGKGPMVFGNSVKSSV